MSLRSLAPLLGALTFGFVTAAEARTVSLERAAEASVAVQAFSPRGGYSQVTLTLRNQGEEPVTIAALPGTALDNQNEGEQDLTFGGPVHLSIGPGQSVTREVSAFCLNQDRSSPSPGARFDVRQTPDPGLAAFIQSGQRDQSQVWTFLRNRNQAVPAPQPTQMTCTGPAGAFQICVNSQATRFEAQARAVAPVPNPPIQIPILQVPQAAPEPPPTPPVVRRHRPRHRPHAPAAPIAPPPAHEGLTIIND